MRTKANIALHYSNANACLACLDQAMSDPATLFEFGDCHDVFFPTTRQPNLLTRGNLLSLRLQSQVGSLEAFGVVVLVAVCLISLFYLWLAFSMSHTVSRELLGLMFGFGFLLLVFLMEYANSLWMLSLRNGCYVSTIPKTNLLACQVCMFVFVMCAFFDMFPTSCSFFLNLASFSFLFVYALLSIAAGYFRYSASSYADLLVFNVLAFLSIFEIPSFLYGMALLKELARARVGVVPLKYLPVHTSDEEALM